MFNIFEKQLDILTIGDIAIDAFIRIKDAHINCGLKNDTSELCLRFGDKVPYEFTEEIPAVGNASNASISASRLGLSVGIISNIGNDDWAKKCLNILSKEKISTKYTKIHPDRKTNYHFVLWYGPERTILTKHENYDYTFPQVKKAPKWIYLTSLGSGTEKYHEEILTYLDKNPEVKLAFQPGTYQIKMGKEKLTNIYKHAEVFICNKEEAKKITEKNSDFKELLTEIKSLGPKIVLITDGPRGAYCFDGNEMFFVPPYPDGKDPYERTGAGDAFSSTFVSALILGKSLKEALLWGPVNSSSVVQYVGAQKGLLSKEKLMELLAKAPEEYKVEKL